MSRHIVQRIIGFTQTAFGLSLLAYVLAWRAGYIPWSPDIAFALMAVCGLLCACAGVFRIINLRALFTFKQKWLNSVFKTAFIAGISLAALIQALIVSGIYEGRETPPGCGFVVIMGAKVYGDVPSSMLAHRIDSAARYLNDNPESMAIACGGFPEGNAHSEAQVIKDRLVANGIAPERIFLDEQSADTRESAKNAHSIMLNQGYSGMVVISSSDYHLYRCMRLFGALGYETSAIGSPVLTHLRPVAHFREMISILRDFAYSLIDI